MMWGKIQSFDEPANAPTGDGVRTTKYERNKELITSRQRNNNNQHCHHNTLSILHVWGLGLRTLSCQQTPTPKEVPVHPSSRPQGGRELGTLVEGEDHALSSPMVGALSLTVLATGTRRVWSQMWNLSI